MFKQSSQALGLDYKVTTEAKVPVTFARNRCSSCLLEVQDLLPELFDKATLQKRRTLGKCGIPKWAFPVLAAWSINYSLSQF